MQVISAIFLRPNLSIKTPTKNEPMGKQIVTKLANYKMIKIVIFS